MKIWRVAWSCALLFVVMLCLPPAHAQQGTLKGLDDYVAKALKAWDIPGVAIAVVKDDSVVLARGYGVRRLGEQAPVNEHTLFGIASCTKAFTSASLAILVDEGKIAWNDPVTKYLPWFQLHDPYATRELMVRDLLSHRSGLPAFGGDLMWWGATRSREEVLRQVRYIKPASSFRSMYAYQNIMFVAAGQIIPAVTGKSWEEFVRDRIFTPLGMTSSSTASTRTSETQNIATPHMKVGGKVQPIAWRNVDNGAPAGAITSNVADLAQWIRLQLGGGVYRGRRIFSAEASSEMWTPQTVVRISPPSPSLASLMPHFQAYGLGWSLRDYRGRKIARHFGETDGISSIVALIPEEHLGVAILTNMHTASMHEALSFWIFDAYLGTPREDWSAKFLQAFNEDEEKQQTERKKLEEKRASGTKPSLPLRAYAGTYENHTYGKATVQEENGKLVVHLTSSPTCIGDLEHWHYDTFESTWRDPVFENGFVVFVVDGQGNVDLMKLHVAHYIEPSEYTFKKISASSADSQKSR